MSVAMDWVRLSQKKRGGICVHIHVVHAVRVKMELACLLWEEITIFAQMISSIYISIVILLHLYSIYVMLLLFCKCYVL